MKEIIQRIPSNTPGFLKYRITYGDDSREFYTPENITEEEILTYLKKYVGLMIDNYLQRQPDVRLPRRMV